MSAGVFLDYPAPSDYYRIAHRAYSIPGNEQLYMPHDSIDVKSKAVLSEDISVHIFTVSAAMVGVCLTVIGIIRIVVTIKKTDTYADDFLAFDAVLFLISCLSSYFALRTRSIQRMHKVERFADFVFVLALIVMVSISIFITYIVSVG